MKTQYSERQHAVTLLELLTVIAVVAVLAVLLSAAVKDAAAAAKRSECITRLGHISRAILGYAAEHDQTLPASLAPEEQAGNADGIWYHYQELVAPYLDAPVSPKVESDRLFACPLDHELAPDHPSYLFNGGNEYDRTLPGLSGRRLTTIERPSRTILVAEAGAFHPYSWHAPKPVARNYADAQNFVGFCDGHVSFIPIYQHAQVPYAAMANPPSDYGYQWSAD